MSATIVQLGSSQPKTQTASFEEAFGEYSEARGRGRARRAARKSDRRAKKKERKMERIEDRDEVKRARVETRQSRRSDRKEGRQQDRIGRRASRKASRQSMRDAQQEARMGRRMTREEQRQQRKDFRTEAEQNREDLALERELARDEMMPQDEAISTQDEMFDQQLEDDRDLQEVRPVSRPRPRPSSASYDEEGYGEEEVGYESESYDRVGQGPSAGSYQGQGYDYGDESEAPYDEEGYDEEGYAEEGYLEDDSADYGDEEYEGNDVYFDGTMNDDPDFSELTDGEGKSFTVPSHVQDVANKIEWNKEFIHRLKQKRGQGVGPQGRGLAMRMRQHQERVSQLEGVLDDYANCCGEFSSADGTFVRSENRSGNAKRRGLEVARARHIANALRKQARRGHGATPVAKGLRPTFGPQRIVIPAAEHGSNATGINAIDNVNDFDYQQVTEVQLGVDGSRQSKVNWTGIAIGVGIGVAVLYALKKTKVI